jgi:transcriptional regulator with XRE-family HTH domain
MRQRRQELGIKLAEFAPRIGVSYGHYRNLEYRDKPAAIEIFHRIARELAVPVDALIDNERKLDREPKRESEHVPTESVPSTRPDPPTPTRPPNKPNASQARGAA